MWRDALLIMSFLLGLLTYFHLTPSRIHGYFKAIRDQIARRPIQIIFLVFSITTTLFSLFTLADNYEKWHAEIWPHILPLIMVNAVVWFVALNNFRRLSGNRILLIVSASLFISSLVADEILANIPLWRKLLHISYPIIGVAIGYAISALESYISKKRKKGAPKKI